MSWFPKKLKLKWTEQNVSRHCYMHANCRMGPRRGKQVSKAQLVAWLCSGKFKCAATGQERIDWGIEHLKDLPYVLDAAKGLPDRDSWELDESEQ